MFEVFTGATGVGGNSTEAIVGFEAGGESVVIRSIGLDFETDVAGRVCDFLFILLAILCFRVRGLHLGGIVS